MTERGGTALLRARAALEVSGPDARDFLQGLISNDVRELAPGRPLYAALLTPQGRYLFDFILHDRGQAILLDAESARIQELRQRLSMYRLRAKVTIAESPLVVTARWGADAPADTAFELDPRLPELGWRALAPPDEAAAEGDAVAYDRHRLRLGVPDGSRDLVPQRSLLLESNFVELHGVSFEKGCYVGQELTARTHYRGLVKKRLLPVRVEGPLPAPGSPIMLGEREAGEMRSGRDGRGLALLRLDALQAGELRTEAARVVPESPTWLGGLTGPETA